MSRKPNKPKSGETTLMHVKLSSELVDLVDVKRAHLEIENPGSRVTRTEVVRRALYAFVTPKETP
jgi:hypothetical protein